MIIETKKILETIISELYRDHMSTGKKQMLEVINNLAVFATWLPERQQEIYVTEVLQPILEAMEGSDSILLADRIKYELIPFIDRYLEEKK